ncbi:MAG TPA: sodium:proton antiporter [Balneolaceae bacterium]|nr:sodium:proton antiporter [Balneolaceae bacterium]
MADHILIGIVFIVVLGIGAQWLAWVTNLPGILLLLIAGILAGPITGFINPNILMGDLLGPFISVSVGIILFEGGLNLKFSELREIGGAITKLVSIGVMVTMILVSVSSYYLFNLDLELSVLLGAILVVTGPTVIIPLLRQVRPTLQVSNVLKWEGIVIDPIGAMLAVLVFDVIILSSFSEATNVIMLSVGKTLFFGTLAGLAGAWLIYFLLKRYLLPDFLQNPVTLMVVILAFGVAHILKHESGLLATTLMGILLANQKTVSIHHIIDFKQNLRVLLLSSLFILLAAKVDIEELMNALTWDILLFLVILIFIIRPVSVYLSTIGSKLIWREKLFVSLMAPRGVVAISIASLFAIQLVDRGYTEAGQLVPIVLITIIATVAFYGLSANWLARWLDVSKPVARGFLIVGGHTWSREIAFLLKKEGFKVLVADSNRLHINKAEKKGLNTYHGNILSPSAIEEINLDGIGKLLALTPNDEVNSLSVIRFSRIFGSSNVFQLPSNFPDSPEKQEMPKNIRGRTLFDNSMNYGKIEQLFNADSDFKIVEITENMDQQIFKDKFNEQRIPMFLITKAGAATPYTIDNEPTPKSGDKIICLVSPDDK